MSTFSVPIVKIKDITPIDGADAIEVAHVFGYQSVVKKGVFAVGDYAVYIPEQAIVPQTLLMVLGLDGKLAGAEHNRVKAIKLRGVVSQGILLTIQEARVSDFHEGMDVAEFLGITKYEPPIPVALAGEVCSVGDITLKYDIENIQRYDTVLEDGERVVMTEKRHGTWCCLSYVPGLNHPELLDGCLFAGSKGLSAQGLVFKNNEKNINNVYQKALLKYHNHIREIKEIYGMTVHVCGEVFGTGIQDLTYGMKEPVFEVFDIFIGSNKTGRYLDAQEMFSICEKVGLSTVPLLYLGGYSKEEELRARDGFETTNKAHLREGTIIKPLVERSHPRLGRVILKSVSPAYLLRKNTNATEFQ